MLCVFRSLVPGWTWCWRSPQIVSQLQRFPFKFGVLGQLAGEGPLERKTINFAQLLRFGTFSMAMSMKNETYKTTTIQAKFIKPFARTDSSCRLVHTGLYVQTRAHRLVLTESGVQAHHTNANRHTGQGFRGWAKVGWRLGKGWASCCSGGWASGRKGWFQGWSQYIYLSMGESNAKAKLAQS